MKQYEAVILTLERLGGQATLAQLYQEVLRVSNVVWKTKTPYASIRRIVQVRSEIFKVRPGLWALESHRDKLGLSVDEYDAATSQEVSERNHSYYQGLLAMIGNLRGFATFIPSQDKNKFCLQRPLDDVRTLKEIPPFTYDPITRRIATVDVTWFNERHMPHSLFEVEHSTDFQNSLLKFLDLQDFSARMVIVAAPSRRKEFRKKLEIQAFKEISQRISFYDYESLARDYEHESLKQTGDFIL